MVPLDATKHKSVGEDSKLSKSLLSWSVVAELLDWIQQLLVENRDVLHATVIASLATTNFVHLPIQSGARTLLAEVAGKWTDVKKTDEGEEFANTILQRGTRQTPLMVCLQSEACLGRSGSTLL